MDAKATLDCPITSFYSGRLSNQPDYSLAEIYNGSPVESAEFNPRNIDFAA
jgi:hypothetical protein